MSQSVYELTAFLEEEGGRKPLYVRITAACRGQGENSGSYCCRVHAPAIFNNDKFIYGVDAEQAAVLAVEFVKSMLIDKNVTDSNGQPVRW